MLCFASIIMFWTANRWAFVPRVLLFPCSLQNSCHVSSRSKPIFSKCCLQNDLNRSGGTPRCLCCGHCADLEVRWKSPGTDHIYRQDCVDFFCARHTEANGNRLYMASLAIDFRPVRTLDCLVCLSMAAKGKKREISSRQFTYFRDAS